MTEELLVLRKPLVDLIPVERHVSGEKRRFVYRLGVVPHGIHDGPVTDLQGAVTSLSLVRARGALVRLDQQVAAHILLGEVVHRQVSCRVQELRTRRVDDRLTPDESANALRDRVPEDDRAGRRLHVEVEVAGRLA